MTRTQRLANFIRSLFAAPLTVRIDDGPGWTTHTAAGPLDLDWSAIHEQQLDALEAWRKNPLARRIVDITTDYVIGDSFTVTSKQPTLQRFIKRWWNHPHNHMDLRLGELCDELTRSGELFIVLHPNTADGMTYVRTIPASSIEAIKWKAGDYETETEYHERTGDPFNPHIWHSPHTAEPGQPFVLHYAINRPTGCVRGESDLAPVLIWLRRYSGWLEDRARLNWASRLFMFLVTVPSNKVNEKASQYHNPPEPGSVVVKDETETWEMITPSLNARDASADGRALRYMIAAGAGLPLMMLSESEGANLATAQAQLAPTLRHFARRQLFFRWMISDIILHAYNAWRPANRPIYSHADITTEAPDINRDDNGSLATASRDIVTMLAQLRNELRTSGITPTEAFDQLTIQLALQFAGNAIDHDQIKALITYDDTTEPASSNPA